MINLLTVVALGLKDSRFNPTLRIIMLSLLRRLQEDQQFSLLSTRSLTVQMVT